MEDILGELDDQDEDDLDQVVNTGAPNFASKGAAVEDTDMAFNKDEELNLKYNMAVGQIHQKPEATSSRKRDITQISQAGVRAQNPFKKQDSKNIEIEHAPEMPLPQEQLQVPEQ